MRLTNSILVAIAVGFATPAMAQRSGIDLGEPKEKLTEPQIKNITACKFTYKLKAGMTNAEAADAIDAGWEQFKKCVRVRARKEQTGK